MCTLCSACTPAASASCASSAHRLADSTSVWRSAAAVCWAQGGVCGQRQRGVCVCVVWRGGEGCGWQRRVAFSAHLLSLSVCRCLLRPHRQVHTRHAPHDTHHTTRTTRHAPHDTHHTTRTTRHAPPHTTRHRATRATRRAWRSPMCVARAGARLSARSDLTLSRPCSSSASCDRKRRRADSRSATCGARAHVFGGWVLGACWVCVGCVLLAWRGVA
jgi:hypothetical protein